MDFARTPPADRRPHDLRALIGLAIDVAQSRAEMNGVSSESGLTAQYSVLTAAQPPSAFVER